MSDNKSDCVADVFRSLIENNRARRIEDCWLHFVDCKAEDPRPKCQPTVQAGRIVDSIDCALADSTGASKKALCKALCALAEIATSPELVKDVKSWAEDRRKKNPVPHYEL